MPLSEGLIYHCHNHLYIKVYSNVIYGGEKGVQESAKEYYTYVRGNSITWHSHKQKVISYSNAEAKY